jgi:hypothetical protein
MGSVPPELLPELLPELEPLLDPEPLPEPELAPELDPDPPPELDPEPSPELLEPLPESLPPLPFQGPPEGVGASFEHAAQVATASNAASLANGIGDPPTLSLTESRREATNAKSFDAQK